jgi:hypothetical protein
MRMNFEKTDTGQRLLTKSFEFHGCDLTRWNGPRKHLVSPDSDPGILMRDDCTSDRAICPAGFVQLLAEVLTTRCAAV